MFGVKPNGKRDIQHIGSCSTTAQLEADIEFAKLLLSKWEFEQEQAGKLDRSKRKRPRIHEPPKWTPEVAEKLEHVTEERQLALAGSLDTDEDVSLEDGVAQVENEEIQVEEFETRPTCDYLIKAINNVLEETGISSIDNWVFTRMVCARVIEPTSKAQSIRVLNEFGFARVPSYNTITRHLTEIAKPEFRAKLGSIAVKAAGISPGSALLYDVSTLYFETDKADDFRIPGYSKERRIEPQIAFGLLTDTTGFPVALNAFEGNKAETRTMIPVLKEFTSKHRVNKVTIIADAGMMSDSNVTAVENEGFNYVIGAKMPTVPAVIEQWRRDNPDSLPTEGTYLFEETKPASGAIPARKVHYTWDKGRYDRDTHFIEEELKRADAQVSGRRPSKKNKFLKIKGAKKTINQEVVDRAWALAGWKGYGTNLDLPAAEVVSLYRSLFNVERSFRIAKSDLRARPMFHRKREMIEAHLSIVFASLMVARCLERKIQGSIRKIVTTLRQYPLIQINDGLTGSVRRFRLRVPEEVKALLGLLGVPHTLNQAGGIL